jgi:hypothetical protein
LPSYKQQNNSQFDEQASFAKTSKKTCSEKDDHLEELEAGIEKRKNLKARTANPLSGRTKCLNSE